MPSRARPTATPTPCARSSATPPHTRRRPGTLQVADAMPSSFDDVIREHLDLKRRNSRLEDSLPLASYLDAGGVFDGERPGEGAAFDTAEWKGKRPKAETFLES